MQNYNEENQEEEHLILKKTKRAIKEFVNISLGFFVLLMVLKLVEFLAIVDTYKGPTNEFRVLANIFALEILFFLKSSFFLAVIYIISVLIMVGKRKTPIYIYVSLCTALIVIGLLLTKYYITTLLPLGADLYGYSFGEIKQTALAGASVDVFSIMLSVSLIVLLWLMVFVMLKRQPINLVVGLIFLGFSTIAVASGLSFIPSPTKFKSDFDYNLVLNKAGYFYEKTYDLITYDEPELDIYDENYISDSLSK